MSTTVTYKGSTLTTVNNQTRTLKTAGKYMEGDVVLTDVSIDAIDGNNLEYGLINATSSMVGIGKVDSATAADATSSTAEVGEADYMIIL